MKISRQIGSTSEILNVYIQDGTVSTGAGLANIVASSVTFGILRDNQATVSTGTCSTGGTLGTYGVSTLTQMNSTNMLGWYQFGVPNYALASGKSVAIHLYGAPNMVPLPMEIELTGFNNQQWISTYSISSVNTPVGVSTVTDKTGYSASASVSTMATLVGVSTNTDKGNYGVSSVVTVGVSSLATNVLTSTAISSAALNDKGNWNVGKTGYSASASVSTMATLVGVSTNTDKGNYGVSSVVTVGVSSNADKAGYGVSSFTANALTSTAISSQALAGKGDWSIAGGVHVTSYGALVGVSTVTDKAGYSVSSLAADVIKAASISSAALTGKGDWNIGKTGYALTALYDPATTAAQAGDAMTLTAAYGVAGKISTNIAFVKGVAVATGTGTSSDPWGP